MIDTASLTAAGSPWLLDLPCAHARARLVFFPYAGAGTLHYRSWQRHMPPHTQLSLVQLPGRELRHAEPPDYALPELVAALCDGLAPQPLPLVLFGHSLGALLAFECAWALCEAGRPPAQLIISGRAPGRHEGEPLSQEPDDVLREVLLSYGAIPASARADRDLLSLALGAFRADLTLLERYAPRKRRPLPVPALVLGGLHDTTVSREALQRWRKYLIEPVEVRFFPGGHFFLHACELAVAQVVSAKLQALTADRRAP